MAALESIVDDDGRQLAIYEQKDIGEFFLNFLDRLQDGLGENKAIIRKLMGDDLARTCGHQHHLQGASQADSKISQTMANKPLLSFEDNTNNQKSELIEEAKKPRADAKNRDSANPQDVNPAGGEGPDLGVQKIDSDLAEVFGGKGGTGTSMGFSGSQPATTQSSDHLGL